ncbi:DUF742 domain-containing protein [Streptomyces sp. NPDC050617]|uniref:DUF742 domain-containing protein n=1 Tax=Streptomyces sp. NPDC050617 TaxID=3154628 RepID=UPI00342C48B2
MATPPGGYPYGNGQQGEPPLKRFNFPSAPSRQAPPEPPRQPESQRPQRLDRQRQWQQPEQRGAYAPYESAAPAAPAAPSGPSAARIEPMEPAWYAPEPPSAAGDGDAPLVRPYAMTGGRTRPRYQLAIEALVHTTAQPAQLHGQLPEHQRICHLCREIKSVAEISALLTIPLGVARILVADLAEAGLVAIHQPGGDESAGGQPDVTLLERVLSGLRKL